LHGIVYSAVDSEQTSGIIGKPFPKVRERDMGPGVPVVPAVQDHRPG